jgi:hypothetical protein
MNKSPHHLHVQMIMQLQSHSAIHSLMCFCTCIKGVRLQTSDDDRQCRGLGLHARRDQGIPDRGEEGEFDDLVRNTLGESFPA